jgi:hypothetical protein
MEVINRLARPRIHIKNGPVTFLMDIRLHSQFLGDLKHLANKCVIFLRYIVERRDVLSWHD